MKDRSTAGKMYRGGLFGKEIRTGLSRRRGGRWSGSFVYRLMGIPEKSLGSFSPGKKTRTSTLPRVFSVESVLLIGVSLGRQVGMWPSPLGSPSTGWMGCLGCRIGRGSATVSCMSWAQGALTVGSKGDWNVLLVSSVLELRRETSRVV